MDIFKLYSAIDLSNAISEGLSTDSKSWFINTDIEKTCTDPYFVHMPVNLWAWVIHDKETTPKEYTLERFNKFNQMVKQIPEIFATHLAFIGPDSIVPLHKDTSARGRNPLIESNLLLGCIAPIDGTENVVLNVAGTNFNIVNGQSILFDGEEDHYAFNYTDEWVVTATLYVRGLK